jgi:putative membrane protein
MIDYNKHDWTSHLFDVEGSMVREITGRVSVCVAWTIIIVVAHELMPLNLAISPTVHTLVGLALGLLLVFRTNASYDRFWEGRRQWGSIINETRNLARAVRAYVAPAAPDLAEQIVLLTAAFPNVAVSDLRLEPADVGPVRDRLPAEDVAAIVSAPHPALAVATRISERLAEARERGAVPDILVSMLDTTVGRLVDDLGACERIQKTPLPFVYVVHLRRTLILYCFTLPFALVGLYGWWTILVALLASYMFFGIEEIGVEIENPFGLDSNDLPLERFCRTIEHDVLPILETGPKPEPAR